MLAWLKVVFDFTCFISDINLRTIVTTTPALLPAASWPGRGAHQFASQVWGVWREFWWGMIRLPYFVSRGRPRVRRAGDCMSFVHLTPWDSKMPTFSVGAFVFLHRSVYRQSKAPTKAPPVYRLSTDKHLMCKYGSQLSHRSVSPKIPSC